MKFLRTVANVFLISAMATATAGIIIAAIDNKRMQAYLDGYTACGEDLEKIVMGTVNQK